MNVPADLGLSVSVIVPCYNGEAFLAECLDSIFGQDRPPEEVVLVDDGSTDGSAEIARRYDSRLRYHLQPRQGAGAARNAGDVRIACNLSGLSVQSPAFRERLLKRLDAEPALVPRLLVEITETAEIEQEAEAIATVEALRARAIPICIDDFGAGAAAFRYLRTFRVDYVKIDGLYVENARRGAQDRGFLSSMVDLARNVGAQVVAERIETEEDAAAMLELGIGFGQGWLFGRPGRLPDRG